MQLKRLDFVVEDIVQLPNRVCVIGQRCPLSSSWRVDISLAAASHHRETIHLEPGLSGQQNGARGNGNSEGILIVIWPRKKREEGLVGGRALARGLAGHTGNLANISQRVPLRRTNRKCPWLRPCPRYRRSTLWRHSDRQLCLDRQCPVTSANSVRANI